MNFVIGVVIGNMGMTIALMIVTTVDMTGEILRYKLRFR